MVLLTNPSEIVIVADPMVSPVTVNEAGDPFALLGETLATPDAELFAVNGPVKYVSPAVTPNVVVLLVRSIVWVPLGLTLSALRETVICEGSD
jgi:hypothetical protein